MSGWTMHYPKEVQVAPDYVLDTRTGIRRYTGKNSSGCNLVGPTTGTSTGAGTGSASPQMSDTQLEALMQRADPFASQRAGYQAQLKEGMTSGDPYGGWGEKMNALMTGDFSATDPSYKWRYEQGLQATQRAGAARGLGASGNEMLALQEVGQGMASQEYSNQFNRLFSLMGQSANQFNATMDRLANLSGAQFSPAASAQLAMQKYGIDVGAATSRYTAGLRAQTALQTGRSSGATGHSWVDPYAGQAAERGAEAALRGYVPGWQQQQGGGIPYTNSPTPSYSGSLPQMASYRGGQASYSASPFIDFSNVQSGTSSSSMPDFGNVESGFSTTASIGGY